MALADVLRERASRRGTTARVDCGALGTLTVEALSPRECAALGLSDGGRALLYAACRELQAAGETLRRERRLFTPDEVTQYLSDGEALAAARTVLELSGVTTGGPDSAENRLSSVQDLEKDLSEIRLASVQEPDSFSGEAPELLESRLGNVQKTKKDFSEIRPAFVQQTEGIPADPPADGQVSREFSENGTPARKTPSMGADFDFGPQNLALSEKRRTFSKPSGSSGTAPGSLAEPSGVHEIKSEFPEAMHDIKSESGGDGPGRLHETTSEFPEAVHEIKSESGGEGPGGLHEATSEFDEKRRGGLHEITSESAEKLARCLLEGLRRAAGAR